MGSREKSVPILWDVSDRSHPQQLGSPLTGHTSDAQRALFAPDGRTLITTSDDGTAIVWAIDAVLDLKARAVELACAYAAGGLDQEGWHRSIPDLPNQASCPAT